LFKPKAISVKLLRIHIGALDNLLSLLFAEHQAVTLEKVPEELVELHSLFHVRD
jgi:hypothetical protein